MPSIPKQVPGGKILVDLSDSMCFVLEENDLCNRTANFTGPDYLSGYSVGEWLELVLTCMKVKVFSVLTPTSVQISPLVRVIFSALGTEEAHLINSKPRTFGSSDSGSFFGKRLKAQVVTNWAKANALHILCTTSLELRRPRNLKRDSEIQRISIGPSARERQLPTEVHCCRVRSNLDH